MVVRLRAAGWLLVLTLVACSGPGVRPPERSDGPPDHTPVDLAKLPDPIPREEPKSARGNPPSYTVLGRTYRVMGSAAGYQSTGIASWYGRKFHGRTTSSGETFDMFELTAAHTTLPIPTYARVTNLHNGRSTIVRINDRGPFHADRLIDLSYAAAVKLGFATRGTARVRVEALVDSPDYFLQAGAFSDMSSADALKDALGALTGARAYVVKVSSDALFRVRIGPVKSRPEALRLQALIASSDYDRPLILEQ